MPSFQYNPNIDFGSFFDVLTCTLTQVTSTSAVWESGDQKLIVSGTGLSIAGGVPTGTITSVRLYSVDLRSGSPVDVQLMTNTTPLSMSFGGMLDAAANDLYGFAGFGYIFGGNDTITGSSADDYLTGYSGSDSLVGGAGNDYLAGDDGFDDFGGAVWRDTLVGGDGDDILSGGNGNDSMIGGNGNDYYLVTDAGDVVVEASGSAAGSFDRVNFSSQSGLLAYTLAANVENLEVSPVSMSDMPITVTGTGNALANKITVIDPGGSFTSSSTQLFGLDGNDRLTGGLGKDTLDGGTGNDTMIGGLGSDTYTVGAIGDVVNEAIVFLGPNTDVDALVFAVTTAHTVSLGGTVSDLAATKTYSGIEGLTLGSAGSTVAHNGIGNDAANTLTGNAAANRLFGLNGDDTLNGGGGNDRLDGGTGRDSLVGGIGNDSYVVDSTTDVISETSTLASEIDSVSSLVTWTLGANLERLALTGSTAINGTGNALANSITGNTGNNKLNGSSGNDTLSGGSGNDTLDGGAGNDSLTGGPGIDAFRFASALNASTNVDRINDFSVIEDVLQLENSIFVKLATTGILSSSNFRANTSGSASDSNDYVLYETDTGQLFYDADGSGVGAKVLIATLGTLPALTSSDFFIT